MSHDPDLLPSALEVTTDLRLDFSKLSMATLGDQHVIPVVVQDLDSGDVLILAYANEEALKLTLKTKKVTLWSTSRRSLWVKGDTSGNHLSVHDVWVNCEQNALLYRVSILGQGACHTQDATGRYRRSCFYRKIEGNHLILSE